MTLKNKNVWWLISKEENQWLESKKKLTISTFQPFQIELKSYLKWILRDLEIFSCSRVFKNQDILGITARARTMSGFSGIRVRGGASPYSPCCRADQCWLAKTVNQVRFLGSAGVDTVKNCDFFLLLFPGGGCFSLRFQICGTPGLGGLWVNYCRGGHWSYRYLSAQPIPGLFEFLNVGWWERRLAAFRLWLPARDWACDSFSSCGGHLAPCFCRMWLGPRATIVPLLQEENCVTSKDHRPACIIQRGSSKLESSSL